MLEFYKNLGAFEFAYDPTCAVNHVFESLAKRNPNLVKQLTKLIKIKRQLKSI